MVVSLFFLSVWFPWWGVHSDFLLLFNWVLCFFMGSFNNSLYIYVFCKVSSICGLSSNSHNPVFHRTENFHFNKVQLYIFSFHALCICALSKNSLSKEGHLDFLHYVLHMLPLRSFIVFHLHLGRWSILN